MLTAQKMKSLKRLPSDFVTNRKEMNRFLSQNKYRTFIYKYIDFDLVIGFTILMLVLGTLQYILFTTNWN